MLLEAGEKVLVVHRRLFDHDRPRFFVGRVDAYEAGVMRVTGLSYVRDVADGQVAEKREARTKLLSLSSGTLIVYLLPAEAAVESIRFVLDRELLTLSDGQGFTMNLTENIKSEF